MSSFEPPPDTQNEQDAWFDSMAEELKAPAPRQCPVFIPANHNCWLTSMIQRRMYQSYGFHGPEEKGRVPQLADLVTHRFEVDILNVEKGVDSIANYYTIWGNCLVFRCWGHKPCNTGTAVFFVQWNHAPVVQGYAVVKGQIVRIDLSKPLE
jgi:hypothetical protein